MLFSTTLLVMSLAGLFTSSLADDDDDFFGDELNDLPSSRELDLTSVAIANNIFTRNLFHLLPKHGNIIFSPLTISTALEMVFLGARKGTAREMRRVLQHKAAGMTRRTVHKDFQKLQEYLERDSKYSLNYVNSLLVQKGYNISESYNKRLQKYYHSSAEEIDFKDSQGAQQYINEIVSNATHEMIPELLKEPLDANTVMFILSAVYFKGLWKTTFDKRFTRLQPFYNRGKVKVEVPMMMLLDENVLYGHDPENGISAVEIPYRGDDFSMLIILPDDLDGLPFLEGTKKRRSSKTDGPSKPITEYMKRTKIDLFIPKFHVEGHYDMVKILRSMGMKQVFALGKANLQGINNDTNLHISAIMHEAVIDVTEEGTEASAATGIAIEGRSARPPTVKFIANHPFLFFIRDVRSGIVVFAGRVSEL